MLRKVYFPTKSLKPIACPVRPMKEHRRSERKKKKEKEKQSTFDAYTTRCFTTASNRTESLLDAFVHQYMIAYSCILFNKGEGTHQARAQNKNKNITIMTQH